MTDAELDQCRHLCSRWLGRRSDFGRFYQCHAGDGFRACVYAASAVWAGSSMLRICLGIDMPSFFSVSANAAVILVR